MADGLEPIDLLRLGLSLDLMLAREARLDHALHQAIGRLGHAYRTRLGQRLESRRYIHCVAENRDARIGAAPRPAGPRDPFRRLSAAAKSKGLRDTPARVRLQRQSAHRRRP